MNNLRFIDAFNGTHASRLQDESADQKDSHTGEGAHLLGGPERKGEEERLELEIKEAKDLVSEGGGAEGLADLAADRKAAAPGSWRRQPPPPLTPSLIADLGGSSPTARAAAESKRIDALRAFFKGSGHEDELNEQLSAARSQGQLRAALRPPTPPDEPGGTIPQLINDILGARQRQAAAGEFQGEIGEQETKAKDALAYCTDLYVLTEQEFAQSSAENDAKLTEHLDSRGKLRSGKIKLGEEKATVSHNAETGGSQVSFSPDMNDREIEDTMALQEQSMRAQGRGNEEETLNSTEKTSTHWTPPMHMASLGAAKMRLGLPAHFGSRFDPHAYTSPLNRATAHNTATLMELEGCLRTSPKYFKPSINMETGAPNAAFTRMRTDLFCMVHTMDLSGDLSKKLIDKCTGPTTIAAMVKELQTREAKRADDWKALRDEKDEWDTAHPDETWDQKRTGAEQKKQAAEAEVKTAEAEVRAAEANSAAFTPDEIKAAEAKVVTAKAKIAAAKKTATEAGAEAAKYPDMATIPAGAEQKLYFVEKTTTVNGQKQTYLEEVTDPKEILRLKREAPNSLFTRTAPHPALPLKIAAENPELMKEVSAAAFNQGSGKALKDLYEASLTVPPPEFKPKTTQREGGFRAGLHKAWRYASPKKAMTDAFSSAAAKVKDSTSEKFLASMNPEQVGALIKAYAADVDHTLTPDKVKAGKLSEHQCAAKQLEVLRKLDDPKLSSWQMQAHFKAAATSMSDPALLQAVYMNEPDSRLHHSLDVLATKGDFKKTGMEDFFATRTEHRRLRDDAQVVITPAEQKAIYFDTLYKNGRDKPPAGLGQDEKKAPQPMSYRERRLAFQMEFLRTQAMAQPPADTTAFDEYKSAQNAINPAREEADAKQDLDAAEGHVRVALGHLSNTARVVQDLDDGPGGPGADRVIRNLDKEFNTRLADAAYNMTRSTMLAADPALDVRGPEFRANFEQQLCASVGRKDPLPAPAAAERREAMDEALGGKPAVDKMMEQFEDRVKEDPLTKVNEAKEAKEAKELKDAPGKENKTEEPRSRTPSLSMRPDEEA